MRNKGKKGFVSLVGAGPGDPGLITLRGAERLADADVVVYDRLANPLLLRIAPNAKWIPVGKQPGHHPVPQEKINAILVENAKDGKRVIRLKGGDPFVFGRGGEEAMALKDAGVPFEIVPGVTSAIAVSAYAGIPVTHRELAGSVAFITGHRVKDINRPGANWLQGHVEADTLVFLMGVKNLPNIVKHLLSAGRPEDTPAAVIERGTFPNQKVVTGTLANIVEKAAGIHPPAVCVFGEVVKLRDQLHWYDDIENRPLSGLRVLNTKSISLPVYPVSRPISMDEFDNQIFMLGGESIRLPVLQILPPQDLIPLQAAVQKLTTYDWLIFTSSNGVHFFFDTLYSKERDSRCLNTIKIAAIGPITAQALKTHGIVPDFIPPQFIGAELGKQIPMSPGERFLLPRSELALPELSEILRGRGGIIHEVSAYSVGTSPPDMVVIEQLKAGMIDVITFFSPSGISGLARMLKQAGYSSSLAKILGETTVACIGPTTGKAAEEMKLKVEIQSQEHTSMGLVKALVKWRKHS